MKSRRAIAALVLAAIIPGALTAYAYWPGMMSWDPVLQYRQALTGQITDWHPPIMQWLWRQFIPAWPGPAPMMILQIVLWWTGLLLLALRAQHEGRGRLAWALLGCGMLPLGLALTGEVYKDSLMAGALVGAAGLIAWKERSRWVIAPALMLVLLAAAMRFNGCAAALPLLIALLPAALHRTRPRLLLTAVAAVAALLAVVPVTNALIGATPSGVQVSLMVFDVGGITERTGINQFPPQIDHDSHGKPIGDPVAANHRCYNVQKWDSYSGWADIECPLGFSAWIDLIDSKQIDAKRIWLGAIVRHPVAYAEHRLTHFGWNTRFLPLPIWVERPAQEQTQANEWGFHITPNPVFRAIDTLTMASAYTPLGWPIVMIALAFGAVAAGSSRSGISSLTLPLALSSFLYGMSYLVVSVGVDLRYHLWTDLGALLATVLILADARSISRRRLALAYAPAALVTCACIALRI